LTVRRRGSLNGGALIPEIAPPAMNMPAQHTVESETGQGDSRFISLLSPWWMRHPFSYYLHFQWA
jgi:hypothetical protein